MTRVSQKGFTIIEVILFLAVSSLLAVGLLGGWGISVNTQTYKDSIRSLAQILQSEYNKTYNVTNGRDASIRCRAASPTQVSTTGLGAASRGASDCVVMGRYIVVDDVNITSQLVVGSAPAGSTSGMSDIQAIKAYEPVSVAADVIEPTRTQIPWGVATYVSSGDSSKQRFVMAILRSPETGTVSTFIKPFTGVPTTDISGVLIGTGTLNPETTICIDPGAPITQSRQGVTIAAKAASSSSIRVTTDGAGNTCQ